jgi:hypothetical protein
LVGQLVSLAGVGEDEPEDEQDDEDQDDGDNDGVDQGSYDVQFSACSASLVFEVV